jgi:hypothetical protein
VGERPFIRGAGSAAQIRGELIDRVGAEIDQVAASRSEFAEKVSIQDCGIDQMKGIAHRSIEA